MSTPPETIEEAAANYDAGHYDHELKAGVEFQDFVAHAMYARGLPIVGYASKEFQLAHGENRLGAEIKLDRNFRRLGNLFLEVAEKSHPRNAEFVPSGIERGDAWLYIIGDREGFYVFPVKYLRRLVKHKDWEFKETFTSQGYLMPLADAENYCIMKVGP